MACQLNTVCEVVNQDSDHVPLSCPDAFYPFLLEFVCNDWLGLDRSLAGSLSQATALLRASRYLCILLTLSVFFRKSSLNFLFHCPQCWLPGCWPGCWACLVFDLSIPNVFGQHAHVLKLLHQSIHAGSH